MDVPIQPRKGESREIEKVLRLCTTHLESLCDPGGLRQRQLAKISSLLKAAATSGVEIIGGLLGGDMNHNDKSDAVVHKSENVALNDAWEDSPPRPTPSLKPFRKDFTLGRAKGNTWGYHSERSKTRKRLDKFFYTGSVHPDALAEVQDLKNRLVGNRPKDES